MSFHRIHAGAETVEPGLALATALGDLASTMPGHDGYTASPIGLGMDIEEVARFRELKYEANIPFYSRFFSAAEIAYCLSRAEPAQHFAARFAAKEAALKAFGPFVELFAWQVEVKRDRAGRPTLAIWDFGKQAALQAAASYRALVSLSHTQSLGAAVVVVFKAGSCND